MLIKLLREAGETGIIDQRHDPGPQISDPNIEERIDRFDRCAGKEADRKEAKYDTRRHVENRAAEHEAILPFVVTALTLSPNDQNHPGGGSQSKGKLAGLSKPGGSL
jgi:hypothetical protein